MIPAALHAVGLDPDGPAPMRASVPAPHASDIETRLRLAIESTHAGTHARNLVTDEADWSPRLREIYDLAEDEPATTAVWRSRVHPDDRVRAFEAMTASLDPAGSGHYRATFRVVRRDGTVRWVEGHGQVAFDEVDGTRRPVRLAGLAFDVTERVRTLEGLREADRRKDEFLAMLAHELRNPLAPLTTSLAVLERAPGLGDRDRGALAIARRQARQLVRLVDDLLEVSRITRGMISLRLAPMGLGAAVYEAVESVAAAAEMRRQTVEVSLPSRPPRIVADAARIAQVLENLLNNASKFTPEGGTIRVSVADLGEDVELRVADSGVGIAPDQLAGIFELFAQAGATLDRSQGGLGIGLALVRRLVSLHGGRVWADSPGPGQGATFTVRLPRRAG